MRVAVVGAGIAGLSSAYCLDRLFSVQLFEASSRLGGHSHTHRITVAGQQVDVDSGFIVYNERNYPDLIRLFGELGVESESSDMSFAASVDDGRIEYSGRDFWSLFAQRSNIARPTFWRMLADIVRFNRIGQKALVDGTNLDISMGGFLGLHGFGGFFRRCYLLPMGAAIWSTPVRDMLEFPAGTFLRFFDNHGLLTVNGHPLWRTLKGRSQDYVQRIVKGLKRQPIVGDPVVQVTRNGGLLEITTRGGYRESFDHVVLAAHADQSRALLDAEFALQRDYLAHFRFQPNDAILHGDEALMPRRRRAWASWNYHTKGGDHGDHRVSLTYWMNLLQNIDPSLPLFVTLNPIREPSPEKVFARMVYEHPVFDAVAIAAQGRLETVQGQDGIWLAGAWLGYGFHEDGARSGLDIAAALGAPISWQAERRTVAHDSTVTPQAA